MHHYCLFRSNVGDVKMTSVMPYGAIGTQNLFTESEKFKIEDQFHEYMAKKDYKYRNQKCIHWSNPPVTIPHPAFIM